YKSSWRVRGFALRSANTTEAVVIVQAKFASKFRKLYSSH
ncbi:MAG: hypothetical protein ACI9E4_001132, partial [Pseudohongiellaceae bacterium]